MSQSLDPIYQPATVADIPAQWIAKVRAALQRDGQACRAGTLHFNFLATISGFVHEVKAVIEVQSINTGEWQPLNLPTNATHFATEADRDAVLEALVGKEKK